MELGKVDRIIEAYEGDRSQVIGILQDVQAEYNYLPYDALTRVSQKMKIPLSQIYSLATFFKAFSLEQRGKHLVTVCMGTACHVRRAPMILEEMSRILGIKAGQTTPDLKFSLETVNCLGACALGPIVVIDGKYFGHMTARKARALLKGYEKE
ncbi:MAG: NAD(P)H-dependent oxidoreductase subunit E [Deltaproteobacteria bacterium]|nr:NAD(P)H-dependent oxidoreductase subunit E [Deltaproteobacteria bacterium]